MKYYDNSSGSITIYADLNEGCIALHTDTHLDHELGDNCFFYTENTKQIRRIAEAMLAAADATDNTRTKKRKK